MAVTKAVRKENCVNNTENSLDNESNSIQDVKYVGTDFSYKHEIVWGNVAAFATLHFFALWGIFKMLTFQYSFVTLAWGSFNMWCIGNGIVIGAHRLFTHKTFKAKPILKALLIYLQTMAGQNSMFTWCRDHRLHHMYADTDADPHNARRGFFFSHMGWLVTKKHPLVIQLGRTVDMSDLQADWMISFQRKYYLYLYVIAAIIIPVSVPVLYFGVSLWDSFLIAYATCYVLTLHFTWLVNSAAHIFGTRPFDNNLHPVESWFVSFLTLGEGWHNYHHAFPWDYKAAEFPMKFLNQSAHWIKFFETIGLAYDLKTVSPDMVEKRVLNTGDGSHECLGNAAAQAAVTAFGPLHPFNPTYNTTLEAPEARFKPKKVFFYQNKILTCRIKSPSA